MANIGFSQRRTLLYLYGWTLVMAALPWPALRSLQRQPRHFDASGRRSCLAFGVAAVAASVYLIVSWRS